LGSLLNTPPRLAPTPAQAVATAIGALIVVLNAGLLLYFMFAMWKHVSRGACMCAAERVSWARGLGADVDEDGCWFVSLSREPPPRRSDWLVHHDA
jgi:hypothetical protein